MVKYIYMYLKLARLSSPALWPGDLTHRACHGPTSKPYAKRCHAGCSTLLVSTGTSMFCSRCDV